jgi:hypothetical protein
MSTTVIGQPFNPYKLFRGIFVPEALVKCTELSPGAKLCYGRLLRYAGKDGRCFPSTKKLAAELGTTRDQARRYLHELRDFRLIRMEPRWTEYGDRDTNLVHFLWHEVFEAHQEGGVVTNCIHPQAGGGYKSGRGVGTNLPPPVGTDMTPPLEESHSEESHKKKTSSSSSEDSTPFGSVGSTEGATETTTTTALCEHENPTPKPEVPDEALDPWREWLFQKRYPDGNGRRLDVPFARTLLALFSSAESAEAYMRSWKPKRFKADGYGLFQADIELWERTWPERRKDLEARAAEAREQEEADLRKAAVITAYEAVWRRCFAKGWKEIYGMVCPNCGGFGRNPDTEAVCSCDAGREYIRLQEYCGDCRDQGTAETPESQPAFPLVTWCHCIHAERKRAKEPEYCETFNAASTATRQKMNGNPRTPRPAARVQPIRDETDLKRRLTEEIPAASGGQR